MSVIERGTVVLTRSDKTKTQVVAAVNSPVFPGDFVATTDPATLAELQLDGYTALRLSGGVQVRIVQNDAKARQIQVAQGMVELAVLHEPKAAAEVVTPPVTVRAEKAGDYRISVQVDGAASITARRGQAELVTPHKTFTVDPGTTAIVRGDAADPTVQYVDEVARDAFDDFNRERDRAMFAALNDNTDVPPDIAGYDNLSSYGRWADVQPYGESWIPNQTSDWAPYRDGTWVWGTSYGWTWVGNEPWGWLPYHYGSWFYANGYGWCWFPPSLGIAPVWFPAFVSFFGYGYGPYGYPYLGWVPLAPYENFYPWYPWYWGYYYPWPPYHPPIPWPPPPPAHHHRGPIHMNPFTSAYRNAMYGGASTLDRRTWRDGTLRPPMAVDPVTLGTVTVRHGGDPIALPIQHAPAAAAHPVVLSHRFDTPRFAPPSSLARLPQAAPPQQSAAERAWSHFYSSQSTLPSGGISAPSHGYNVPVVHAPNAPAGGMPITSGGAPVMSGTPVMHAPSAPVEHGAPVERAPAAPPAQSGTPVERGGESHGSSRPPS